MLTLLLYNTYILLYRHTNLAIVESPPSSTGVCLASAEYRDVEAITSNEIPIPVLASKVDPSWVRLHKETTRGEVHRSTDVAKVTRIRDRHYRSRSCSESKGHFSQRPLGTVRLVEVHVDPKHFNDSPSVTTTHKQVRRDVDRGRREGVSRCFGQSPAEVLWVLVPAITRCLRHRGFVYRRGSDTAVEAVSYT